MQPGIGIVAFANPAFILGRRALGVIGLLEFPVRKIAAEDGFDLVRFGNQPDGGAGAPRSLEFIRWPNAICGAIAASAGG